MAAPLRRCVLVSASPRRKELLEAAGYEVVVRVPSVDESFSGPDSRQAVVEIAERKLDAVPPTDELAVAADTLVLVDDERLGKPADEDAARDMLRRLSGRMHEVVTGFAVARGGARRRGVVATRVWFRPLSALEIERYVSSGDPLDKAGAYAIQGGAGAFVDKLEGSYTNVIGLPLAEVLVAMESLT
ncbi:MAG: septum formation protein Maf [Deltaproteobacteria bacterium]|nr:septum formation protein Maf [Deltaproteobacteria bacterium]